MTNKHTIALISFILFLASLGCSSLDPLAKKNSAPSPAPSNKTLADKGVETAVGDEKIGIPECDEAMDMMTAEANNPDDGYIVKAGKQFFFNKIKEQIRTKVEENKGNTAEIAKNCKEFKTQLDKYKAEEEKSKNK